MKKQYVIPIIGLFVILALVNIFVVDREFWFDESFSMMTSFELQEGNDINWKEWDVHPPTYYYLFAGWMQINPGFELHHWARMLSVLLVAIGLFGLSIFLSRLFDKQVAWMVLLLFALGSTYIHYGTEARSYALVFATMVWAMVYINEAVYRNNKWLLLAGSFLVGCLAWIHYYSAIGAILALTFIFFNKKRFKRTKDWLYAQAILIFVSSAMLIYPLMLAVAQRSRGDGMWFAPPTLGSWPSAITYGLFMPEGIISSLFVNLVFWGIMVMILWFGWRTLFTKSDHSENSIVAMVCMVLPAVGLLAAPIIGGEGFAHLYHHRFFIVVMWFAIMMMFGSALASVKGVKRSTLFVIFVLAAIVMLNAYTASAHHELERVIEATPCEYAIVMHESPFSALPAIVADRERGCDKLTHAISTNLTQRQGATAGFDALSPEYIYRNLTLPEENFYYLMASGVVVVDEATGRWRQVGMWDVEPEVIYIDNGINLTYVRR